VIYKELDVYKRSYRLAVETHKFSLTLPKEFRYDLADQIRRASRSIPSNIAEGYARKQSNKEIISFLKISLGSNDEILFNLEFMKDANLMTSEEYNYFSKEYIICGKQLTNLINSLNTS
jgi:four helix bundle protein